MRLNSWQLAIVIIVASYLFVPSVNDSVNNIIRNSTTSLNVTEEVSTEVIESSRTSPEINDPITKDTILITLFFISLIGLIFAVIYLKYKKKCKEQKD